MKKLLLVLISFFTLTSFVNSPNYSKNSSSSDTIPYNNFLSSYGYKTDRMWLLNGLVIPVSDTTFGTDTSRVGAIVYKPSDSTLYIWNGLWSPLKGGSSGSGTVTSVAMTTPPWLTVGGSPITGSGTLAVSALTGQTANQVLATPNGSTGAVSLRSLTTGDIPDLSGNYIENTTTLQPSSNFFISDKGTIAGSLSVRGDSLWVPTKDIALTSPASNIYRIFSNTNITNSSHITLPVEGVDIHAAQFGLSYTGSADVDSSIRNQISGIRGALSLAGTGGSGSTFSAELSPLSGIGATLSAFNDNHYTDAADVMAGYPYTYTATGLALFSGTIDNFYQIYLQGKVTNDIDANITNKWGIYQASTYPNKFGGGLSVPILATTLVSTTITTENYTCIYTGTSSAANWTIPAATTCIGSVFHFVAQAQSITLSQSYISLSGTSGQTSVAAGSAVTIQSDGTNWYQIQ